jgi:hypothetical protein
MSNNISSNISTRESVSSILESSIRELSDVVNSASDSDPSINQINKEISNYEHIIDSDTFYKDNEYGGGVASTSYVTENFYDTNSTFSKWYVILLVIVFIIIGFIYFMRLRKEKNKLINK